MEPQEKTKQGLQGKVKELQNSRTLSDREVRILKNKFADIEDNFDQIKKWKDIAVTKFNEIDDKLELAKAKIIEHEQRIKELENAE